MFSSSFRSDFRRPAGPRTRPAPPAVKPLEPEPDVPRGAPTTPLAPETGVPRWPERGALPFAPGPPITVPRGTPRAPPAPDVPEVARCGVPPTMPFPCPVRGPAGAAVPPWAAVGRPPTTPGRPAMGGCVPPPERPAAAGPPVIGLGLPTGVPVAPLRSGTAAWATGQSTRLVVLGQGATGSRPPAHVAGRGLPPSAPPSAGSGPRLPLRPVGVLGRSTRRSGDVRGETLVPLSAQLPPPGTVRDHCPRRGAAMPDEAAALGEVRAFVFRSEEATARTPSYEAG
ncbi:hypothetical protein SMICM17S_10697 [Streptomyces microflavus]